MPGLAKRLPVRRRRAAADLLAVPEAALAHGGRRPLRSRAISPGIGVSVRSRRIWQVLIHEPLVAEGLPRTRRGVLQAMQDELYGRARRRRPRRPRKPRSTWSADELVVLGSAGDRVSEGRRPRRIVGARRAPTRRRSQRELKELRKNFHALQRRCRDRCRDVRPLRLRRPRCAGRCRRACRPRLHRPRAGERARLLHRRRRPPGRGAGLGRRAPEHRGPDLRRSTTAMSSSTCRSLVSNLEGCERKDWQEADRTLAAKTVEHLLHLIAKVTPGAKMGSTAPYDWASLVLVEAGDEQPRTLANAFLDPVARHPTRRLPDRRLRPTSPASTACTARAAAAGSPPGSPGSTADGRRRRCRLPALARGRRGRDRGDA